MNPWWLLLLLPAAFWLGFLTMALMAMAKDNSSHFPRKRKHPRHYRCF